MICGKDVAYHNENHIILSLVDGKRKRLYTFFLKINFVITFFQSGESFV